MQIFGKSSDPLMSLIGLFTTVKCSRNFSNKQVNPRPNNNRRKSPENRCVCVYANDLNATDGAQIRILDETLGWLRCDFRSIFFGFPILWKQSSCPTRSCYISLKNEPTCVCVCVQQTENWSTPVSSLMTRHLHFHISSLQFHTKSCILNSFLVVLWIWHSCQHLMVPIFRERLSWKRIPLKTMVIFIFSNGTNGKLFFLKILCFLKFTN